MTDDRFTVSEGKRMVSGALLVAKKRVASDGGTEGPRPIVIAVRGRSEWKEWADRLKDHASKKMGVVVSLNALVGLAMAHYAKAIGFKEEPPER